MCLPRPHLLGLGYVSEDAHPGAPCILVGNRFGVDDDLVGKGVRVGGGDGGNVVFVAVDYGNDLVGGFLERLGHGAADLEHICRAMSTRVTIAYVSAGEGDT